MKTATQGVATSVLLAGQNLLEGSSAIRPSTMMGVYASMFLSANAVPAVGTALDGIRAQMMLYFSQTATDSAASTSLEQLGTTLQVDIADMLNRSDNRAKALDDYLIFLDRSSTEATAVRDNLAQQKKDVEANLSKKRSEASTLKRDVDKAVSSKDFATAGGKQELLNAAQGKVTELDSKRQQLIATISLIDKLLGIAKERSAARSCHPAHFGSHRQ